MNIEEMTIQELKELLYNPPAQTNEDLSLIRDRLSALAWDIGLLMDKASGIDPDKGGPVRYGTPNKRSHTYKIRKIMGYSYP